MSIRQLLLSVLLMGAMAGHSRLAAQDINDQNQERQANPYTVASMNGEFALVGTYTGGVARQLGVVHFDDGDVTGFLRVNVQGSTPTQRLVVYISFKGVFTIAENGTGVASLKVTYPDGSLHQATLDTLITRAHESKGVKIATEVATMQRETPALSPDSLIVGTLTRRPE